MEKYAKKTKASEIKEGQLIDDIFFVKFKKGIRPYSKGYFFEITLSDNSGANIDYKYWGGNDESKILEIYSKILPDSIIKINAKASSYNGKLELSANESSKIEILNQGQYEASDFLRKGKKDIDALGNELLDFIGMIENAQIKKLMESIFKNPVFFEKFKIHPAAIEIHHGWAGGLIEHSLEVLKYCKASWEIFPNLDKDLMIAGSLLHDLGKMEELQATSRIKGTIKGQLHGHLLLGSIFVFNKCQELGIDEDIKIKLLHIMASHHGKLEYGAAKEPMIPEALAVYYADELSSKLSEMIDFIDSAKQSTEDEFMYSRRGQKNIFLK